VLSFAPNGDFVFREAVAIAVPGEPRVGAARFGAKNSGAARAWRAIALHAHALPIACALHKFHAVMAVGNL